MMTKRLLVWLVTIGGIVVLGASGLAGWLWISTSSHRAGTPTTHQIQTMESELVSNDPAKVGFALDLPPGTKLSSQTLEQLSALRPITIDPASMNVVETGVVTANATVHSGMHRSSWHVTLIYKDKQWHLEISNPATGN